MSKYTISLFVLLLCGCGPARLTWRVQRSDLQETPVAQSRYAIKSMVVSFPDRGQKIDALQNDAIACIGASRIWASRDWVEMIYEAYPNVFSASGMPISVTLEQVRSEEDERSGLQKFLWSIGWVTLVPLIPVEWIENSKWTLSVSVGEVEGSNILVKEYDERRRSVLPIGYLCFFADDEDERFRTLEVVLPHREEDLRMQMKAFGAGIAAELISMEKEGRIKDGGRGANSIVLPRTPAEQEIRARILAEERKKNLELLLKAGVITEEERRKEIGKEAE